jgi:hypothetical protein
MISICRDHCMSLKRWRDGQMVLRWCAAGMHFHETVTPVPHNQNGTAA